MSEAKIEIKNHDALIIVDVQKDFLPGGALAVPEGNSVIPVINSCIRKFSRKNLPIIATRDWHPADHASFLPHGGPWPPHCVQGTRGVEFSDDLKLPPGVIIVSKARERERDAYSGFQETELHSILQGKGVKRIYVGGLATDYCVLNTVKDGLKLGYDVFLIVDAIKAVDVNPGDGDKAIAEMASLRAILIREEQINGGV